jgi:hypothetical protein
MAVASQPIMQRHTGGHDDYANIRCALAQAFTQADTRFSRQIQIDDVNIDRPRRDQVVQRRPTGNAMCFKMAGRKKPWWAWT